jgi:hypothetical protein
VHVPSVIALTLPVVIFAQKSMIGASLAIDGVALSKNDNVRALTAILSVLTLIDSEPTWLPAKI